MAPKASACLTWSKTPKVGFLTTVLISGLWNYIKNVSLFLLYLHSFEAIINNSWKQSFIHFIKPFGLNIPSRFIFKVLHLNFDIFHAVLLFKLVSQTLRNAPKSR